MISGFLGEVQGASTLILGYIFYCFNVKFLLCGAVEYFVTTGRPHIKIR